MTSGYEVGNGEIASLWFHRRRRFVSIIEGAGFTLIDESPRDPVFGLPTGQRVYLDGILDVVRTSHPHLEYDLYQEWMDLSRSGEPERW